MSIKETLQKDLTEAIRGRNEITSGTIRMVLTAITNEEVSGKESRELSDSEVLSVLTKEAKKRRESVDAYLQAGRKDLADKEYKYRISHNFWDDTISYTCVICNNNWLEVGEIINCPSCNKLICLCCLF